jgi:serine/threonine-protein kinase
MATVYRATERRHQRPVAIKVLLPELARAVTGERFLREIAILARLSHPHILPLIDSGTVDVVPGLSLPWYAMPFVADDTLRARIAREGPLPLDQALRLTTELCSALSHAHAQGVVHRDIKPENVLLPSGQALLADFGIARAITVAGGMSLSSSGLVVGTPIYMSPEQSAGSQKLDARSDIYSLGCVLYEMLAGQPPFTGVTPQAISARHQFETPPPIRVVRPTVPPGIEAVIGRTLAKVPADRYGSAEEFARAIAEAPRGEGAAATQGALAGGRRGRRRARHRGGGGGAAGWALRPSAGSESSCGFAICGARIWDRQPRERRERREDGLRRSRRIWRLRPGREHGGR